MQPSPSPPTTEKVVVLVDDEVAYLELFTQLLGGLMSCSVRGFTHPQEALNALPGLNVGIVLTDYRMPGMNGFEFINEVQKISPAIPVLLITGQAAILSDEQLQGYPALRGVIAKPFKWSALTEEITKHWAGGPRQQPTNSAPSAGNL